MPPPGQRARVARRVEERERLHQGRADLALQRRAHRRLRERHHPLREPVPRAVGDDDADRRGDGEGALDATSREARAARRELVGGVRLAQVLDEAGLEQRSEGAERPG